MRTEISYNSSSVEVYGGRLQLLFALFLDEQEKFPWINEAIEEWKAALVCGLVVELDECLKSNSELMNFLKLTDIVMSRLRGMTKELSKDDLASIDKGLFGSSSYAGGIETRCLIDTLLTIQSFLKGQIEV